MDTSSITLTLTPDSAVHILALLRAALIHPGPVHDGSAPFMKDDTTDSSAVAGVVAPPSSADAVAPPSAADAVAPLSAADAAAPLEEECMSTPAKQNDNWTNSGTQRKKNRKQRQAAKQEAAARQQQLLAAAQQQEAAKQQQEAAKQQQEAAVKQQQEVVITQRQAAKELLAAKQQSAPLGKTQEEEHEALCMMSRDQLPDYISSILHPLPPVCTANVFVCTHGQKDESKMTQWVADTPTSACIQKWCNRNGKTIKSTIVAGPKVSAVGEICCATCAMNGETRCHFPVRRISLGEFIDCERCGTPCVARKITSNSNIPKWLSGGKDCVRRAQKVMADYEEAIAPPPLILTPEQHIELITYENVATIASLRSTMAYPGVDAYRFLVEFICAVDPDLLSLFGVNVDMHELSLTGQRDRRVEKLVTLISNAGGYTVADAWNRCVCQFCANSASRSPAEMELRICSQTKFHQTRNELPIFIGCSENGCSKQSIAECRTCRRRQAAKCPLQG